MLTEAFLKILKHNVRRYADITYGFQPKSCGLMYKIPALDTVAGVAVLK